MIVVLVLCCIAETQRFLLFAIDCCSLYLSVIRAGSLAAEALGFHLSRAALRLQSKQASSKAYRLCDRFLVVATQH
jgi:hypothetical protein